MIETKRARLSEIVVRGMAVPAGGTRQQTNRGKPGCHSTESHVVSKGDAIGAGSCDDYQEHLQRLLRSRVNPSMYSSRCSRRPQLDGHRWPTLECPKGS